MTDSQSFWAAAAAENVDDVISQASLQLWVAAPTTDPTRQLTTSTIYSLLGPPGQCDPGAGLRVLSRRKRKMSLASREAR